MNHKQYEQLFTDLTPEQAAVVEGGAYRLNTIEGIRVSADPVGGDEPYINANGKKIWSGSLEQGGTANIGKTISASAFVTIYDDDPWPNPDDPIGGGKTLPKPANGRSGAVYFDGGAGSSRYRLTYTVV